MVGVLGARSNRSPIGVNITGRFIHAVQLKRSRGRYRVTAATSLGRAKSDPLPSEQEVRRLTDVLERRGFRGRDVVLALPQQDIMTAAMELPPGDSGAPLEQIARSEIGSAYKCDPDQIEVGFWKTPEPSRKTEGTPVRAIACERARVDALLDSFEAEHFRVRAVDAESCAIVRAGHAMLSSGATAIVAADWDGADFIVTMGDVIVYERRSAELGLHRLRETLLNELHLDADVADYVVLDTGLRVQMPEGRNKPDVIKAIHERIMVFIDELAAELNRSITYVMQEYGEAKIERVLLTGDAAGMPGLVEQFSSHLDQQVAVLIPEGLGEMNSAHADASRLVAAFGLAQYMDASQR